MALVRLVAVQEALAAQVLALGRLQVDHPGGGEDLALEEARQACRRALAIVRRYARAAA